MGSAIECIKFAKSEEKMSNYFHVYFCCCVDLSDAGSLPNEVRQDILHVK